MKTDSNPPLGIFLANHNADTGMKFWDLDRWIQEIQSIKTMGANTIWFLPIQYGQKSAEDFLPTADHWLLQKNIATAIAAEGLRVGVYQGLNDVFPATLGEHPEWQAESGKSFGQRIGNRAGLRRAVAAPGWWHGA